MDEHADQPDDADDELDDLDDDDDDDLDNDDEEDVPRAGRGTGQRTPKPAGPIDRRIGAVAQQLCDAKGWSYQDLANRIRPAFQGETWDKSRAGRFLRGSRRVTVTELADILRALDVSPRWFYEEAEIIRSKSRDPASGDVTAAIMVDQSIDAQTRQAFVRQYEWARNAQRQASNGDS